jgi:hypothetical protein
MRRGLASLGLFARAAGTGASSGCITAFAPDIRREEHHVMMSPRSTRGTCLTCHELESHMAKRMKGMDEAAMKRQMADMDRVIRPPLVADWMAKDRRGCVDCHAVKGDP